jgi:hypothetical protein
MSRPTRRVILPILLAVFLAGPAFSQESLDDVRARLKIEAQRIEKRYREDRLDAYAMVRTDPGKLLQAVDQLIALKTALGKDTSLPAEKRQAYLKQLDRDIRAVQAIARERKRAAAALPRVVRDSGRERTDRAAAERRKAFEEALGRIGKGRDRLTDMRDLRRLRGRRFLQVGDSIARSTTLPVGDIEFPADWAEKTKRRSPANKLTDKEKALLKALEAPISVDFTNQRLSDVLDYFRKRMGQEIIVEKRALAEVGAGYDATVSLKLSKTTTRTALKRVLADVGLTYAIKDEAILVTSPERARQMVTTRVYYVGDLAPLVDIRFGPWIGQLQLAATVSQITWLIVNNIEPNSWRVNNPDAPGTIIFDPIRMALIVRQTAEMHYKLQGALP